LSPYSLHFTFDRNSKETGVLCVESEGITDDRCQWQMKGGRLFAEREMIANKVKRESTARGGATVTELTELRRIIRLFPVMRNR